MKCNRISTSIIEAAFYGNNVVKVNTLKEAYELAKNSPGTIVTDMPVYRGEEFGLEKDAKVLLFNDGSITGRYAAARRVAGEPGVNCDELDKMTMDAIYDTRWTTMYFSFWNKQMCFYHEFRIKTYKNFCMIHGRPTSIINGIHCHLVKSKPVGDGKEPDIYIFSNPQWRGTDKKGYDPKCLCYFNTDTNCAAILGMRYFGEHKKGTLTIAWV